MRLQRRNDGSSNGQIDREAQKDRGLKDKQQKDANREQKTEERQARDAEHSRMIGNRKRGHPIDDTSSMTDADADKENDATRYIDITIDTSQVHYTHSQRVLGEIQSTTSQQSLTQHVLTSTTKRYQLMSSDHDCVPLHSM
jgi:hypothetical protein